jgi:obg-like ATPase 1
MSCEDLKEYGSESAVKAAGKLRQQGKPYESKKPAYFLPTAYPTDSVLVVDGDIAYWKAGN